MADKQDEILTLLHGLHAILPTLATKADLAELRAELRAELHTEVGGLRVGQDGLRADVNELRVGQDRLRADVNELRDDVGELRADVAAVQSGLDELRRVTSVNHYKAIGRIEQVDARLDRVIAHINLDRTNH